MTKDCMAQKVVFGLLATALVFGCCIASASAAYTATFTPSGGVLTPGAGIQIAMGPTVTGDPFDMTVSMTGNKATAYTVSSFNLPFSLTGGGMTATGTSNVNALSINIRSPSAATYSCSGSTTCSLTSGFSSGTYTNNGVSITPTDSTQRTSVNFNINGNIGENHAGGTTMTLNTNGASYGSTLTVTIGSSTPASSVTYSFPSPTEDASSLDGDSSTGTGTTGQTGTGSNSVGTGTRSVSGTGTVTSGTVYAGINGLDGAAGSWSTGVTSQPSSGATITTTINEGAPQGLINEFQSAYSIQGGTMGDIAYTMTVSKNGVTTSGPATITMTVPRSWVENHGGPTTISICRKGDDGKVETLVTTFKGYDPDTGAAIFEAVSPNGLSIFAVVALTEPVKATPTATSTVQATTAVQQPTTSANSAAQPVSTTKQQTAGTTAPAAADTRTPLPSIIPVSALVLAIVSLALIRKH